MSSARQATMGKMQAFIDGHAINVPEEMLANAQEIELDTAAAPATSSKELLQEKITEERANQEKIKTEQEIARLEALKRKAESDATKEKAAEEIKAIKEGERLKEEEEKRQKEQAETIAGVKNSLTEAATGAVGGVDETVNRVTDVTKDAWSRLANVITPGTIFLPVSILIAFYFFIIPVNGKTRIEWLWLALTGNAMLSGDNPQQANIPNITFGQVPTQPAAPGSAGQPVYIQAQNAAGQNEGTQMDLYTRQNYQSPNVRFVASPFAQATTGVQAPTFLPQSWQQYLNTPFNQVVSQAAGGLANTVNNVFHSIFG